VLPMRGEFTDFSCPHNGRQFSRESQVFHTFMTALHDANQQSVARLS